MDNIVAFTGPGSSPPYISINAVEDGVSIIVRGEPSQGQIYGPTVTIFMTDDDWAVFAEKIRISE